MTELEDALSKFEALKDRLYEMAPYQTRAERRTSDARDAWVLGFVSCMNRIRQAVEEKRDAVR